MKIHFECQIIWFLLCRLFPMNWNINTELFSWKQTISVFFMFLELAESTGVSTISSYSSAPAASPKVDSAPKVVSVGTCWWSCCCRSSSSCCCGHWIFVASSTFIWTKSTNNFVVITFPSGFPSTPPFINAFCMNIYERNFRSILYNKTLNC